ncbi:MAG: D-alanine--D-alanine ligase [Clostridia bacterium]|jgi:D-alanine-D-alanine ligase|nr:D-alanine--D-alanine ligase [Clostridia bacterium]
MKTVVGVFFGGKSVEHEVSIISALQAMENLDQSKYDVVPVYISKDNRFFTSELLTKIEEFKDLEEVKRLANEVYLTSEEGKLVLNAKKGIFKKALAKIDVVFPVVHGLNVEDGTLEGLLEMYNIPYVGCDVCASAVGMNKIIFKKVLEASKLPVVEYVTVNAQEFEEDPDMTYEKITRTLNLPIIVKPANLGSSVGIEVIKTKEEYKEKMQNVFVFCESVLIERCVTNLREINCSVVGNFAEQECSVLEEPIKTDEILSYKDKYMGDGKGSKGVKGGKLGMKAGGPKSSGMASLTRKIPAELTKAQEDEIYSLAKETFKVLNCEGISRIDFIIDGDNNKVYVNEINTIPGSLSFYLWEPKGIPFNELLDKAIRYAIKRKERRDKITYSTNVNILNMTAKK